MSGPASSEPAPDDEDEEPGGAIAAGAPGPAPVPSSVAATSSPGAAGPRMAGRTGSAGGRPRHESAGDARLIRRTRVRLVAWSALITLAIVVGLGLAAYVVVGAQLAASASDRLRERADTIVRAIERLPDTPNPALIDRRAVGVGLAFGGRFGGTFGVIVGPAGQVIGPTEPTLTGLPLQAGVDAALQGRVDVSATTVDGTAVWVVSEPATRSGQTYVVQVVGDRESDDRTLGILLVAFGVAGVAALGLSVGGGWVYAQRALAPIRSSLRRQREFAADASHELRTPLTVIRGTVEHLERHPERTMGEATEELGDVKAEVDHLTELVESLLLLARADSGAVEVERVPTDLSVAASAAADLLRPLAEERGVTLVVDAAPAPLVGDPLRLRQLATILTDNAVRLTRPGGTVSVRTRRDGGTAVLAVDDQGPGIRADDAPHLFERFWRAADAPPGGSGLGLSIAAWIADRHSGRVVAANLPGGGARFEARLAGPGPAGRADQPPPPAVTPG